MAAPSPAPGAGAQTQWSMAELLQLAQDSEREIVEMRGEVTEGLLSLRGEALSMQREVLQLCGDAAAAQGEMGELRGRLQEDGALKADETSFGVKLNNIALMQAERGFDVVIVCTSDEHQAAYWQDRLESARGGVLPARASVVAVDEDWDGGAGNFLGTLYAWQKACARHRQLTGGDLAAQLREGASVALFHTAGKGTRLAPLPGAENNNKPGVKLPAPGAPSILESVIRQTGAYAASRRGRLSVFWGDQVFVPSACVAYEPRHHVDIMCALGPMPSAEEWSQRGLDKYGLIAVQEDGSVASMLEKVSHGTAVAQLEGLGGVERVGASLGSFSLSAAFLAALLGAFSQELEAKSGKMDSDPHVWMPMTLAADDYAALMAEKGLFDGAGARAHHARVQAIVGGFDVSAGGLVGMFGAVDVGLDCSWWDYGQLRLYAANSLLLTEDSEEGILARAFFNVDESSRSAEPSLLGECLVDAASVAWGTRAASGSLRASALAGVSAERLEAEGAVLVNVCARTISAAEGSVAYNVVDHSETGLVLGKGEVRVGIFTLDPERRYFEMRSNVAEIDGGKAFDERVCGNALSFREVYELNRAADVAACARAAAAARAGFAAGPAA